MPKVNQLNRTAVKVGDVEVGAGRVVVQSMTNTDTADAKSTAQQIYQLHQAGSELVRITVNNEESAAAVPEIIDRLHAAHCHVPVIGDFHYNGHRLLQDYPLCAEKLAKFESFGLAANKIIVSCKVSSVQSLIRIYQELHKSCHYALHLGLTEAGMGNKGIVASTAALSVLLQQGIGDTIRVSLTPEPNQARTEEVKIAQQILQSLELQSFKPEVTACPGCGRTTSEFFQVLAKEVTEHMDAKMPEWRLSHPGVKDMNVAVMGCIVNGPGESKHADIGISLPGTGETPSAPIFIRGKKTHTLKGDNIARQFIEILDDFVKSNY